MNQKLQQAIQATRAGENKKAQYLLTQTLQEEPENTQAWYLLSLLVDSEEKQVVYLQRVLALDPVHEKAQARLQAMTTGTAVATPVVTAVTASSDYAVFSNGPDETAGLPDWMIANDEADTGESFVAAAEELLVVKPERASDATEDVPTWLQQDALEDWTDTDETAVAETTVTTPSYQIITETITKDPDETETDATTSKALAPVPTKATPPAKKDDTVMTAVLVVLVLLAVVVGLLLVYTLINL